MFAGPLKTDPAAPLFCKDLHAVMENFVIGKLSVTSKIGLWLTI